MPSAQNAEKTRLIDAERNLKKRAEARDLRISKVADPIRRRDCLADTVEFLRVYHGNVFYQAFTSNRREMIAGIEHAAIYGGDQAIAGPRGDGKTRTSLFVAEKLLLSGQVRFPIILSKSGPRASRELKNLKEAMCDSPLLLADFPEVFEPIIKLGRWASRARQQTAYGIYTNLEWGEECIILPTIKSEVLWANGWNEGIESAARGQIAASLGIEGPVRGYSVRNERPDLAIIDDIDDRESARSELQTSTRGSIIEEDVGGLAGPDKTIARVMLCTKINDACIAATFTDRKLKPSWRGRIYKLIDKFPDNMELWEEYIALRQGRNDSDPDARKAHEYYLANREAMDAGSAVSNPYRFDCRPLADGEPGQVSALQACFDLIADRNWDHFNTEYQNEPPASEKPIKSGLTKELVASRLSGLNRRELPPDCQIVIGIDPGKMACHWTAVACRKGGVANIIQYGIIEVYGTEDTDKLEVIEQAILRALIRWKEELDADPFRDVDGNPVEVSLTLMDSGYCPPAVYEMVRRYGGMFRASKGKSNDQATKGESSTNRKVGNFWTAHKQDGGMWLFQPNADYWKRSVHERFLCDPIDQDGRPRSGSLTLFVPAGRRDHRTFCQHIMAEEWVTEFIPGKGEKSHFVVQSANNHWLDATALALCAGEMIGLGIFDLSRVSPKRKKVTYING